MLSELSSPRWIARLVAATGSMTILSALLPAIRSRVDLVTHLLPGVVPAAATTGALAAGVLLVLLSRALARGKFRAWVVCTAVAGIVVPLHLAKGFDIEEALITFVVFVLLLRGRRNFTARPDPRSLPRVAAVAVLGPVLAAVLGWTWLTLDGDGQDPGTSAADRLREAVLGLVGLPGPVHFVASRSADHAAVGLLVLGASVLVCLLLAAMKPAEGPHPMSADELDRVRAVLADWGKVDSLSYFATRQDRCVIFSRSGKAAISYRVIGTVSLAAGDPIGDPEAWPGAIEAWLDECTRFGWIPAVLGVSEAGATAFDRAGLDTFELGDEAILNVAEFSLEGRRMRVVRQAVARCERAGLVTSCHRVGDLDEPTRLEIRRQADAWRDGPVERGFSMALGRVVDPVDADSVVVLCHDADGRLRGLLNLAPWGPNGLSLDLMRRDRETENGIVELMVVALWRTCPELGVHRFSLNFAVFRSVFARGERLGAGPVHRLWHAVLMGLSRFWQIESLYRANAKYQPEWVPRFLCFRRVGDLPRVATAALRAEAFLVAPAFIQRLAGGRGSVERGRLDLHPGTLQPGDESVAHRGGRGEHAVPLG